MHRLIATCLLLLPFAGATANPDELLSVDQAFRITTLEADDKATLRVGWEIAEGYYMYRHRFGFASLDEAVRLGPAVLPAGKQYRDEFFGDVETYRDGVVASLPVTGSAGQVDLEVKFQGCADAGLCYPPQTKTLTVGLPTVLQAAAAVAPSASQHANGALEALGLGNEPFFDVPEEIALPEDEAFKFEAIAMSATELLVRFTAADGYYLYRDKFAFELTDAPPVSLGEPQLGPGMAKVDEHFGDVQVFYGELEIPLALLRHALDAVNLKLVGKFQGCKEAGICYPPMTRTVAIALPEFAGPAVPRPEVSRATKLPDGADEATELEPLGEQDRLAKALSDKGLLTIASFFGFGLLLAFTPCVFPMVPILAGIIAGQGASITTRKAFTLSLVYVLAMALTYTVAGVLAGMFGKNLQAVFQNAWVLVGFATIFVLLALSMFGFYELQLPAHWQAKLSNVSNRQSGGSLFGVAVMGVLSALIVGPCVAPPLAGALIYIGQSGDAVLGGAALFALSLGMGAPLLIFGTGAGELLPRAGAWMDAIKAVFGVGLLALAIWMLERILNPTVIMALWGVLLFGSGVYMGAFDRIAEGRSGWFKLWKALGLVLVLLGAAELVGAAAGGNDWLQPLKALRTGGAAAPSQAAEPVSFESVKSLTDLQSALAADDRPAMLDFYADWCVDCKRMDKYTFPEPPVQAALASGRAFKADVTANDSVDQALMRHFEVIGPPMILFFDANGEELRRYRVVGYQKPEPFAEHVARAFEAGKVR